MLRTMMTAVLGVAVLGGLSQVKACEACARLFRQTEGKLIKLAVPLAPIADKGAKQAPITHAWVLQAGDKTYTLELGSRTLTRLAASLEGQDVVVTGPRDGGKIDVRDIAAKPEEEFTGVVEMHTLDIFTPPSANPVEWMLVDGKASTRLIFESRGVARKAQELVGKKVRVTGKKVADGIKISAIEEVK